MYRCIVALKQKNGKRTAQAFGRSLIHKTLVEKEEPMYKIQYCLLKMPENIG